MRRWALLATAVVGLVGCSGYRDPVLRVTSVQPVERSDEAILLDIAIETTNPNTEALALLEFRYTFTVEGDGAYRGRRSAEATLAPGSTRTLSIPAVIRLDDLAGDGPQPWRLEGSLHYLTPGELAEILLDTGLRRPKVAFAKQGTLELER